MAEFEVEYASFTKIKFEAKSQEEAELIASIMEGDEIEEKGRCEGYVFGMSRQKSGKVGRYGKL